MQTTIQALDSGQQILIYGIDNKQEYVRRESADNESPHIAVPYEHCNAIQAQI